ncbi:MAG: hypothetical protein ACK46Y_09865, partial [Fluviicola sp.]
MKRIFFFTALLLIAACKPIETNPDILTDNSTDTDITINTDGDNTEIEKIEYRATETILTDLINTKLEVRFLWEQARMFGKETLTAKPHWYPQNKLILDAKGMEINSVSMNGKPLTFIYENDVLT